MGRDDQNDRDDDQQLDKRKNLSGASSKDSFLKTGLGFINTLADDQY